MEVQNISPPINLRICRFCLAEDECQENIFRYEPSRGIAVWKIVEDLTQMKVSKDDGFPETICGICLQKVIDFESFKRECIRSAMTLHNILASKGVVGVHLEWGRNGGINCISEGCTSVEKIDAEEPCHSQDVDLIHGLIDCDVRNFEQGSVSSENYSDLPEISCRNLHGNTPMDGQSSVKISSLSFREQKIKSEVLSTHVQSEDNNFGLSCDLDDAVTPFKMENNYHIVPSGITDYPLSDSLENPDSEELRTSNLNIAKEEPLEEDSDTKLGLDMICDKDQNLNCLPTSVAPTDHNPLGCALAKEENSDEVKTKPSCSVNEFLHQSYAMPQLILSKPIHLTEAQTLHSCLPTSSLHSSASSRTRTESLQNAGISLVDVKMKEEPDMPKQESDSGGNGEFPVDSVVSSCARLLSVPVILKTRTKSIRVSSVSCTSSSHPTYPDAKELCIHPTQDQSNSTSESDIEENTSSSHSLVRVTRESLQRAAKKQHCTKYESSVDIFNLRESQVDIFKCLKCRKEYKSKYFLAQHIWKVHQKAIANRKSGIDKDKIILSKHVDGLFHCMKCERVFGRRQTLEYHIKVVHKGLKKQYKCHLCGTYVSRKDGLKAHFKQKHSAGDWVPFPCQECNSVFGSKKSLRDHERRVHQSNGLRENSGSKMECTVCKKAFNRTDNLNRHMAIHQQHRKYVCEVCGKTFKEERCMKMHKRRKHEVKKSHQCGHCNRLFVTKYEVQTHVKVHLKEQIKTRDEEKRS